MASGVGFRIKAEETRRRAERAPDAVTRRELQKLAAAYLDLADRADRGPIQQQQQPQQKQSQPKTATEDGTEYRPES
jgi:hypothetical protein